MFIDTHAHINKYEYENIDEVISSLKNNIIINSGTSKDTVNEVLKIANEFPNFYATIGIHPEDVDDFDIEFLEKRISNKVVAIGEIGLDYHYENFNKKKQKEIFIAQLDLAQKYNKPVVIHSRDAVEDTYEILKNYKLKADIHCFSSSVEMAKKFIDLGCYIGIGGTITFKNARKNIEVLKEIDISRILLETDSPYLSPEPLRGTKNTPNNLKYVVEKIAEIKELSYEKTLKILNENATRFFELK